MSSSLSLRRRAAALVGVAALCATAVTNTPAATAFASGVRFAPVHLGARPDGFNQDGGNWSGYAATGSGFTNVVAKWTEPHVTCTSTRDLFAPWVGIDGYGTSTVEQTGVATDCSSGSPQYSGWYEMYPAAPVYYSNPVSAGDQIVATVTRSGTSYTLTLSNTTKNWTKTTVKSMSAQNKSAEVIMESPTAAYPNFGKVKFTGAKVDGAKLGSFSPVALDASNGGGFEDHTTALTKGTKFNIKYLRE